MSTVAQREQSSSILRAAIQGWHALSARAEEIDTWRHRQAFDLANPLSNGFLRQSDPQTLLSLQAIAQWIQARGAAADSFHEWGVISASRFVGRLVMSDSVHKYVKEGPPTTSPHIIPHRSLHSLSGTISMALGSHGPNVGVGGGAGHVTQGLLTALLTLREQTLPGVWLVLSEWEPEPTPATLTGEELCHVLVVAFVDDEDHPGLPTIEATFPRATSICGTGSPSTLELVQYLNSMKDGSPTWLCESDWGCRFEIRPAQQQDRRWSA